MNMNITAYHNLVGLALDLKKSIEEKASCDVDIQFCKDYWSLSVTYGCGENSGNYYKDFNNIVSLVNALENMEVGIMIAKGKEV